MSKVRKSRISANDQFNGMFGTVAPGQETEEIVITQAQISQIKKQRAGVVKRKLRRRLFDELQERYSG